MVPPFQRICMRKPKVFEKFLDLLSASECAYIFALLDLDSKQRWKGKRNKYANLLRDIPEYAERIESNMFLGHRVFLIGQDIDLWNMRLNDPLQYWDRYPKGYSTEKPLNVWVAIISKCENSYLPFGICATGEVPTDEDTIEERQKQGAIVTRSIPLDSQIQQHPLAPTWRESTIQNANNIHLVWVDFPKFQDHTSPRITMCPLGVKERKSGDLMGGNHSNRTGQTCDSLSPSATLRSGLDDPPSPSATLRSGCENQVIPTLLYIKLVGSEICESENYERTICKAELFESRPNNYALFIKFNCIGARAGSTYGDTQGPDIRADEQVIPW